MTYYRGRGNSSVLIDDEDQTAIYIGLAPFGSSTGQRTWQIRKIDRSTSVTSIYYADGNDYFDNIWDDRGSLTYK